MELRRKGVGNALDNLCDSACTLALRPGQQLYVWWFHPYSFGSSRDRVDLPVDQRSQGDLGGNKWTRTEWKVKRKTSKAA